MFIQSGQLKISMNVNNMFVEILYIFMTAYLCDVLGNVKEFHLNNVNVLAYSTTCYLKHYSGKHYKTCFFLMLPRT